MMSNRLRQAVGGLALASLAGLPAGAMFGRSTLAGASADATASTAPTTMRTTEASAATATTATVASEPPTTTTAAPATTIVTAPAPAAATAAAATTTTAPATATTAPATATTAAPSATAALPATAPADAAPADAAPAAATVATTDAAPAPNAPATIAPATETAVVELADSEQLSREITDELSVLVAGQVDRVTWVATPSAARSLLTFTVRFVDAAGSTLDERSAKVRFTGHAERAGSLDVTVPDGAAHIEIEWTAVGGTIDVHDIGVDAIATAPPAPGDSP